MMQKKDVSTPRSEVEEMQGYAAVCQALDGGTDGLEAYRALIPQAARLLAPRGALVVEVGHGQSRDIEALMTAAGLTLNGPAKADLAGVHRAVAGLKLPP